MKKVLLVAAVAAFAMTSCKKDRTCECTSSYSILGTTYTVVSSNTQKSTKKGAQAWCEAGPKATSTTNGVSNPAPTNVPTCTLK